MSAVQWVVSTEIMGHTAVLTMSTSKTGASNGAKLALFAAIESSQLSAHVFVYHLRILWMFSRYHRYDIVEVCDLFGRQHVRSFGGKASILSKPSCKWLIECNDTRWDRKINQPDYYYYWSGLQHQSA